MSLLFSALETEDSRHPLFLQLRKAAGAPLQTYLSTMMLTVASFEYLGTASVLPFTL